MPNQSFFRRASAQLLCSLSILLLVGCTTTPGPSKDAKTRDDIATYALSLLNTPYVWGGQDVETGFDCSGFISHVYRKAAGIELRGNAASMAKASRAISSTEVLTGDLVFFNTKNRPASHVGIYVGDNKFVHASNPRTGVRVDRLDNTYYAQRFEGAKTLLSSDKPVVTAQMH
jgi:cell wall-associated NlpC family hydrolase